MAQALVKLENIDQLLRYGELSPEQIAALFIKIRDTEDLRVTQLSLDEVDISQVPQDVLTQVVLTGAISSLKIWSAISPHQLVAIFTRLANQPGDSILKKLEFGRVDLTSVSPVILVGGIQRLEEMGFFWSDMRAAQVNAILSMVSEGRQGRLLNIVIYSPTIIGGDISPVLLQSAKVVGGQLLDIDISGF